MFDYAEAIKTLQMITYVGLPLVIGTMFWAYGLSPLRKWWYLKTFMPGDMLKRVPQLNYRGQYIVLLDKSLHCTETSRVFDEAKKSWRKIDGEYGYKKTSRIRPGELILVANREKNEFRREKLRELFKML